MMGDEVAERLRAEEPKIKERQERIEAELKALDVATLKDADWAKEWAGRYYTGDGLGTNIRVYLAPNGGVSFLNYGCLGLYGGDHGDIEEALPDGLKLKLVFGTPKGSFLSERIYFVRWGKLRFLVPDWQLLQVVNNYNEGGHSQYQMYGIARLQREGEPGAGAFIREEDVPKGLPELPEKYAKLLRQQPIMLKVKQVTASPERHVTGSVFSTTMTIEFDGGADQGVYLGMEFWYRSGQGSSTIRITKVDAGSCTGEMYEVHDRGRATARLKEGDTIKAGEGVEPKAEWPMHDQKDLTEPTKPSGKK